MRIATECKDHLRAYFPGREIQDVQKQIEDLVKNNFSVINCSIDELERQLKDLPPGRKQIVVTRWEDQVTAIVNELDVVY